MGLGRRLAYGLGTLALTTAVIIGLAEAVACWVYRDLPPSTERFGVHGSPELAFDPLLGWKTVPGLDAVQYHRPHHVHVRTNADGFRDDDFDEKKRLAEELGAKKVLVLGDSYAYGWGLLSEERLTEQVDDMARRQGDPVVSFNFGIPGFGTGQQLRVLETWIDRIEPDIVVLHLIPNDFANIMLPYVYYSPEQRVYRPFFDDQGELALHAEGRRRPSLYLSEGPLSWMNIRWLLDRPNNIVDDLYFGSMGIENRVVEDEETGRTLQLGQMFFHREYDDLLQRSLVKFEALLERMKQITDDRGARFVVLVPFKLYPHKKTHRQISRIIRQSADEVVPMPPELARAHWSTSWRDSHHNYLANIYLARDLLMAINGESIEAIVRESAWYENVPTRLEFDDPAVSRFVFGSFEQDVEGLRWFARPRMNYLTLRPPTDADRFELTIRGRWLPREEDATGPIPWARLIILRQELARSRATSEEVHWTVEIDRSQLTNGLALLQLEMFSQEPADLELLVAELEESPALASVESDESAAPQ